MKIKILRGFAIFLMLEIGLVHYFSAQHEFEEAWILGYLFVANFIGALVAAYGIYRQKRWGWGLGLLIALGSLAGYVWSRTTGLPFLPAEEWLYPWGVTSVITESLYCLMVPLYAWWARQTDTEPVKPSRGWRYLLPVAGLLGLVLINFYTYRMDTLYPELDHEHVFFLWQVRLQPEVSQKTLDEEYGLQVARVATTARDSFVDVRMKVLDPEKAEELIEEGHFALLIGDKLIPSPHVSRHMLVNKTIIVLFPNQNMVVKPGTLVSVVFESLKVEPVASN
ncbi:MAG: hypothetical protein ACK2U1_09910 [Anaerolineales bacterium]